jgi:hypothetical protein
MVTFLGNTAFGKMAIDNALWKLLGVRGTAEVVIAFLKAYVVCCAT